MAQRLELAGHPFAFRARLEQDPRPQPAAQHGRQPLAARPLVGDAPVAVAGQSWLFALLLALGAELRLGQVVRARRSDLDLIAETFKVLRRGKKRGTVAHLTVGQLAAKRIRGRIRGEAAPRGSGTGSRVPVPHSRRTPQLSQNPNPNPEPNKPRRFRVTHKRLHRLRMTNGPASS